MRLLLSRIVLFDTVEICGVRKTAQLEAMEDTSHIALLELGSAQHENNARVKGCSESSLQMVRSCPDGVIREMDLSYPLVVVLVTLATSTNKLELLLANSPV